MPAKDLIAILEILPQDAKVYYFDTWWESENWGDNDNESAWNEIDEISYDVEDNTIHLI